jgi:hypothetical protein
MQCNLLPCASQAIIADSNTWELQLYLLCILSILCSTFRMHNVSKTITFRKITYRDGGYPLEGARDDGDKQKKGSVQYNIRINATGIFLTLIIVFVVSNSYLKS